MQVLNVNAEFTVELGNYQNRCRPFSRALKGPIIANNDTPLGEEEEQTRQQGRRGQEPEDRNFIEENPNSK